MSGPEDRKDLRQAYQGYLRYTGLGLTMAGVIIAFTFLGHWLDGLLHWRIPVLTIVLSMVGVAGAMLYLFKTTSRKDP